MVPSNPIQTLIFLPIGMLLERVRAERANLGNPKLKIREDPPPPV
jgi:hypothetical protein